MKLLHTADWHLGRMLHGRKRYEEFASFLDWLAALISSEKIDALVIAGDIFDTGTPSNRSQELYYGFLKKIQNSPCRDVIVVSGNHDSPSFLDAPKSLLKLLNVHVIGEIPASPSDEIFVLKDASGSPSLIVCAVPYLRDKDLRSVEPGESSDDKSRKLIEGLKTHYAHVCAAAEKIRADLAPSLASPEKTIPILATGHLFTSGGKTVDEDGVRDLYVGSLGLVDASTFPASIDYLALGHLHVPQVVADKEHFRYSGSPIQMGFGEAGQTKSVVIAEFTHRLHSLQTIPIPSWNQLLKISGSLSEIQATLSEKKHETAWVDVEYTGEEPPGDLKNLVLSWTQNTALEILRTRISRHLPKNLADETSIESLEELDEQTVFSRCLDSYQIPAERRQNLTDAFSEIFQSLLTADPNKE